MESVKVRPGGARKDSPGGLIAEPKSDQVKSKTSVKELPMNNASRTRVLVHSNARKILPRKGRANHETDVDPENTAMDEVVDVSNNQPFF